MPLPFALGLLGLAGAGQYAYDKYRDWRAGNANERAAQQQQQRAGQIMSLLGTKEQPYQMSEAELFPGEQPIQNLRTKGTGLLGGEYGMPQFMAKLAAIPGYEGVGVKGLLDMITPGKAESPFAKIDTTKFTPESIRQFAATGDFGALRLIPGSESGFTLGPGQVRYDAQGRQIAAGGADPELARKEQETRFNYADKLRDEFTNITKGFSETNAAYGRISASVKNPSPSGDISLVFNFMKMLDPGSTVREGEAATVQNAGGISDTIRNLYNKLRTGEMLQPGQRADFLNRAGMIYKEALTGYNQQSSEYKRLSENFGVNPADVIINRQTYDTSKNLLSPQEAQELETYRKKYGRQ